LLKKPKKQLLEEFRGKPVEPRELKAVVELKADKEEFKQLKEEMVRKGDVRVVNQMMEVIHNQINHL
jgi:molybdenum cofactor biosynthesis enzyme